MDVGKLKRATEDRDVALSDMIEGRRELETADDYVEVWQMLPEVARPMYHATVYARVKDWLMLEGYWEYLEPASCFSRGSATKSKYVSKLMDVSVSPMLMLSSFVSPRLQGLHGMEANKTFLRKLELWYGIRG